MVFALLPTSVNADSSQTIYNDQSTGINVSVNSDDLGKDPMNVTFIVVVDGENKQQITLSDITQTLSYLNINAEGYNISCEGDGISATQDINNKWNLQILRDNSTLTINLISEKTMDAITISDYGTFHWMKGEATTAAYHRQLTIYVNDEEKYIQDIYTPIMLNNADGSNRQYWFTPSDSYNDEVTYNHPYSLDSGVNRNLEVYLTTKCPCGQDYCECPGGKDCSCKEDCTCELCNPLQGETEIRTPYGVIEYKKPSGSGYNLTIETYVNGVLKDTTDQLRIRTGGLDCLNYTLTTNGYYYSEYENSYDIITGNNGKVNGASWDHSTGYIFIPAWYRDSDNVLKVYLWTFENHAQLAVEPKLAAKDNVTGYMISYEAYDPETGQNETFTYQGTSFGLIQRQIIPIGTDVTLTAICNSAYEVDQWSTADAYSVVELKGIEGQNGTEAYGNSATINVTSTAYDSVLVYMDTVRKVELPKEDDLVNNPENYFDDGVAVIVDCITNEEHPDGKYGLKAGTFNIGKLEGSSNEGYRTTLTITQPNEYINDYVSANGEHTRSNDDVKVIDLQWGVVDGKSQWKAVEPATYEVQCETDPGTTIPEKPDELTVEDLLKDNAVTIDCINNKVNHDDKTYGLLDEYTIGEVTGNATQGYTVDITVTPDAYVTQYNIDTKVTHELSPNDQGQKIIQLEYDETDGWVVKGDSAPVVYTVMCEADPGTTIPEKPDELTVEDLLKDNAVTIDCINNKVNHDDKTYGLLGEYTIGEVTGDETKGYKVDITVEPDEAYVIQYNKDTGVQHSLSADQEAQVITLVYDGEWKVEGSSVPVTFTVICDSDTGDQTDPSDPTNPDDDNPVNPGGDDGNQGGNDNIDDGNGNNTGNTNDNVNNSGNTNNNGNGNNAGQNGNQNVNNGNTTNGNGAGTNGTTSSTNSSQNPKTSDDSAIVTWMSLVVLAAGGIAVITKKTLKKNK